MSRELSNVMYFMRGGKMMNAIVPQLLPAINDANGSEKQIHASVECDNIKIMFIIKVKAKMVTAIFQDAEFSAVISNYDLSPHSNFRFILNRVISMYWFLRLENMTGPLGMDTPVLVTNTTIGFPDIAPVVDSRANALANLFGSPIPQSDLPTLEDASGIRSIDGFYFCRLEKLETLEDGMEETNNFPYVHDFDEAKNIFLNGSKPSNEVVAPDGEPPAAPAAPAVATPTIAEDW